MSQCTDGPFRALVTQQGKQWRAVETRTMEGVTADAARVEANGSAFAPIERPDLMARLDRAASFAITTIVAPAGYGKSTALRQHLAAWPGVIFRAARGTARLDRFVASFSDALGTLSPAIPRTCAEVLTNNGCDPSGLATWMLAHLRECSGVIAIEDLHHCIDHGDICAFLTALIGNDCLDGRVRWILTSRTAPPLPLASWIAYGRADIEIGVPTLRFTFAEYVSAASSLGAKINDTELRSLYDLLDGWPAALTFTLRAACANLDSSRLADQTRDLVYAYLAEQVWGSLSSRAREFLVAMLFLPHIDACVSIAAGYADYEAILEYLVDRVSFITRDDYRRYHVHDLFHDFILSEQLRAGRTRLSVLVRAGEILERAGDIVGALDRYVAAGAGECIFNALSRHGDFLLQRRLGSRITDALDLVADRDSPEITVLRAERVELDGDPESAIALYRDALSKATSPSTRTHIGCRLARALAHADVFMNHRAGEELTHELIALHESKEDSDPDRRGIFGSLLAQLLCQRPCGGARAEVLARSIPLESMSPTARHSALMRLAVVRFYAGDHDGAVRLAAVARDFAIANGYYWIALSCESLLFASSQARGDYLKALQHVAAHQRIALLAGDQLYLSYAASCATLSHCYAGDFDSARQALDGVVSTPAAMRSIAYAAIVLDAFTAISTEEFSLAHKLLKCFDADSVMATSRLAFFAYCALGAALNGERGDAIIAIESFDLLAPEFPAAVYPADFHVAQRCVAIAESLISHPSAALERIAKALPPGPLMWISELDDAIAASLRGSREPGRRLIGLRNAGRSGIAILFERALVAIEARHSMRRLLTDSELRILKHLISYRSNPEIATAECLTVNTVKSHVSSILRKVGATRRAEAVARARELGLL